MRGFEYNGSLPDFKTITYHRKKPGRIYTQTVEPGYLRGVWLIFCIFFNTFLHSANLYLDLKKKDFINNHLHEVFSIGLVF